jgi:hypothetical protein
MRRKNFKKISKLPFNEYKKRNLTSLVIDMVLRDF